MVTVYSCLKIKFHCLSFNENLSSMKSTNTKIIGSRKQLKVNTVHIHLKIIYIYFKFCVYVCMDAHTHTNASMSVLTIACGNQKAILCTWLSSSTFSWVFGIKFTLSGLPSPLAGPVFEL